MCVRLRANQCADGAPARGDLAEASAAPRMGFGKRDVRICLLCT